MVTKKKIIENELMKEIVSIRVDALWKMLRQKKDGLFPEPYEEGATGKLDNKGAIFIPGGLIYKDVDEMPICYDSNSVVTPESFRKKVREAMQYDNATLLFPDGIATGINLDSGFFSKAARHIYTFREAAFRRKKRIKDHNQTLIRELKRKHQAYTSEDIFAEYKDICILGILRIYSPTKIGKRPQKYSLHIVSPEKDIGLNIDQLRQAAQKRYHFRVD